MNRSSHTNSAVELSVIVPCYQQPGELAGCLEALSQQHTGISFEVLVIDSGNDPAVQAVCQDFPQARLIPSLELLFCGAAKHAGAQTAAGPYLAFTDSDCRPEPDWVENAYRILQAGHQIAGGPVLDGLPNNLIAVSDNALQFSDVQPGRPAGPIKHIPGCNLVIRKETYFQSGGFSPLNSGDDVQLTSRVGKIVPNGIHFMPDLKVRHLGRTNLSAYLRHHQAHGRARGRLGLHLTARQQRLGKHWWLIPFVAGRRYLYILTQNLRFNPVRLLRNLLLSPLLLLGMLWYAAGFRAGCIDAATASEEKTNE